MDRLVDQIVDKAAAALGVDGVTEDDVRSLADLNANTVNNVIFTQRKGKKGYDERQVDYFLNACVQLLSRLESYAVWPISCPASLRLLPRPPRT